MGKLICDICGGKIAVQAGGKSGECVTCGALYHMERLREMAAGTPDAAPVANTPVYTSPDLPFMEIRDGVLVKYSGNSSHVIIPAGVTVIGEYAFAGDPDIDENDYLAICDYCDFVNNLPHIFGTDDDFVVPAPPSFEDKEPWSSSTLTSISIPSSVTTIGEFAFYGCSKLESVSLPSSVTSIGSHAFFGCTSLASVTIPSSVTAIGQYAFTLCSGLTSVHIPDRVTVIEEGAFRGCSGLTSVTIPSGVTSIGDHAFFGCSSLTSVTIPNSVTSIGQVAFSDCPRLSKVSWVGRPDFPGMEEVNRYFGGSQLEQQQSVKDYRRAHNLCQHCGGAFSGRFIITCSRCGAPKDY